MATSADDVARLLARVRGERPAAMAMPEGDGGPSSLDQQYDAAQAERRELEARMPAPSVAYVGGTSAIPPSPELHSLGTRPPVMRIGDPEPRVVTPGMVENARDALRRQRDAQAGPAGRRAAQQNAQSFAERRRKVDSWAPVWPANPSGILPGEEQVTSRDTWQQLSPADQTSLRQKFETGGHADAMDFDEWLSSNFGDLPPQDRAAEMRSSAAGTPRMSIGRDTSLPPGTNSPLAEARLAAGKPLPEGREPGQYSPGQRRTMARNVHNPEVPMTQFGGTFTLDADGSMSSRAPTTAATAQAEAIAKEQGDGSPSHVVALAQAYGIDAKQYGNDLDLLRADVMREKARHDALASKYDVATTPMGGTRYAANPEKMAQARLDNEAKMSPERKMEFARTILQRYGRMLSDQDRANISTYVQTPDGFTRLRELNQMKRMELADKGAQAWQDRQANFRMTTDMRNPNLAPGLAVRTLIDAVRSGDPVMLATVNDIAGNPRGAQRAMDLAMSERAGAAALAQAEMAAQAASGNGPKSLGQQLGDEFSAALAISDKAQREEAVRTIIARNPANQSLTPDQVAARARGIIASHLARANPQDPAVQSHLQSLRGNKPAFIQFVREQLLLSPEQAEQMYSTAAPGWSAHAAGQAVGGVPGYAWGGVANFFRGMVGAPAPGK
jgi:hypothetical protein